MNKQGITTFIIKQAYEKQKTKLQLEAKIIIVSVCFACKIWHSACTLKNLNVKKA
jgi:hypothetical protein